jgi:hypothetical protein
MKTHKLNDQEYQELSLFINNQIKQDNEFDVDEFISLFPIIQNSNDSKNKMDISKIVNLN